MGFKYNPEKIHGDDLFGIRYRIKTFKKEYKNEYLVGLDVLVNLLQDYDFNVIYNNTIDSLVELNENPLFTEAWKEILPSNKKIPDDILDLLKFLRVVIVENKKQMILSEFNPDDKRNTIQIAGSDLKYVINGILY